MHDPRIGVREGARPRHGKRVSMEQKQVPQPSGSHATDVPTVRGGWFARTRRQGNGNVILPTFSEEAPSWA